MKLRALLTWRKRVLDDIPHSWIVAIVVVPPLITSGVGRGLLEAQLKLFETPIDFPQSHPDAWRQ